MMYLIKFNNIRARQGLITNKIVRVAVRATMLIAYANCHIYFPYIHIKTQAGLQPAHLYSNNIIIHYWYKLLCVCITEYYYTGHLINVQVHAIVID